MKHCILDDDHNVVETGLRAWAEWFETGDRIVEQTHVGQYLVSTTFLGIDHNFSGRGRPVLFETMVFDENDTWEYNGEKHRGVEVASFTERYHTWADAQAGHQATVKDVLDLIEQEADDG